MGKARCIMGFAGHMIDQPDRKSERFPAYAEQAVQDRIHNALLNHKPEVAISSAACGGDIIFAEEALALNIPVYIILPFEDREEFIELSVAIAGEKWVSRFLDVCTKAKEVLYVHPGGYKSDVDFEENQHAIIFFAMGYSKATEIQMINLALFDNTKQPDGEGGTQSFMKLCKGLSLPYEVINLAEIRNEVGQNGI